MTGDVVRDILPMNAAKVIFRFFYERIANTSFVDTEMYKLCFIHSVCSIGYYGMGCRGKCSAYCVNNEPCDHVSGECSNGCQDGYIGIYCNSCKKLITSDFQ